MGFNLHPQPGVALQLAQEGRYRTVRRRHIVPLHHTDGVLVVAMISPFSPTWGFSIIFLLFHGKNRTFLTASSLVRSRSLPCAWWQYRMRMLRARTPREPMLCHHFSVNMFVNIGVYHGLPHSWTKAIDIHHKSMALLVIYIHIHPVVLIPFPLRPWRGLHCNILDATVAGHG